MCFRFLTMFILFVCCMNAGAQRPKMKYNDVAAEDFVQSYTIDKNAQAVVLFDYCKVKYEGDNEGDFNVIYKYHKRIRLLNKNAFDVATVQIPLYKGDKFEEKIEKLDAVTSNLDNGKVVTAKIDKSAIFKDKVSKNFVYYKFTLPDLKEGSIIEYSYTVSSPFSRRMRDWYFQGAYPVLWSEYDITIPSIFEFTSLRQGYHPYTIDTVSGSNDNYLILFPGNSAMERSEVSNVSLTTYHSTWAMKDIPALKSEPYTTTIGNHISKISFQLSGLRYPNQPFRPVTNSWMKVVEELLKDENFGADLSKKNNWFDDEVKQAIAGAANNKEKAKKLFDFVRDHYNCINYNSIFLSQPIKKTFQAKKGNVADINLLLVAMYRSLGIKAHPIILSTRDNGKAYDGYPLLNEYNYIICQVEIDGEKILTDASQPKLGFGLLDSDVYNGSARLIDEIPYLINLDPNTLKETKTTNVFIINNEETKGMAASFKSTLGYYESLNIRNKFTTLKKDDFFAAIKKAYGFEIDMSNTAIEDFTTYESPVQISYDFKFDVDEDIIYFSPLLTEAYKDNPFKSAERFYPVEMPYTSNETYILNMEIPKGYKVDEMPKSARVKLNEEDGMFEYIIGKSGNNIQLRCSIKINKAVFMPEDYETLRDFYGYIVKKQAETIVFKKEK